MLQASRRSSRRPGPRSQIKKRLAEAEGKEAVISKEVANLDRRIEDLNRQIVTGQHDISSLESDIRTMQAQIDQVQARFKQAADASNARARRLYVQGPAESVAMLFSADSIVELTRLQLLLEKSSEQDSKIIVDTSRLRSELLEKQNEFNRIKGSLAAQKDWLRTRRALADSACKEKANALAGMQKEIAETQAHIDGLEADSRNLESALRKSASRGSETVSNEGGAASGQGFVRPVSGSATSAFGRRWGRSHTGVDLDGNTGDPIRAATDGTVLGVSCGVCTLVPWRRNRHPLCPHEPQGGQRRACIPGAAHRVYRVLRVMHRFPRALRGAGERNRA